MEQRVPIAWTECHLGGRRPWFICSVCNRRDSAALHCGRTICLPPVLWAGLCKSARNTNAPGDPPGSKNQNEAWRQCQSLRAVPEKAEKNAPTDISTVAGPSRGRVALGWKMVEHLILSHPPADFLGYGWSRDY
jgi:hypothetical protein